MKIIDKILSFGLPKESHYDEGKYHVTYHAVDRMNERKITKRQLRKNLKKPPIHIGKTKFNSNGDPSYERFSMNLINARINPNNNNVTTVSRYSHRLRKKYLEERKGKGKCKNTVLKLKG